MRKLVKIRMFLALMLAVMLLSVACGGDAEQRKGSKKDDDPEPTPTEEVLPELTATPEITPTEAPTPSPTPTLSPAPTPIVLRSMDDVGAYLKSKLDEDEANGEETRYSLEIGRTGETHWSYVQFLNYEGYINAAMLQPLVPEELINDTIPGFIGATTIVNSGAQGLMRVGFVIDIDKWTKPGEDFQPVIYGLNEFNQRLYAYDTTIEGNMASILTTTFGSYVLIDKVAYDAALKAAAEVDLSQDPGTDSNNDGISDYLTKLMCDGAIRAGTGAKIFNGYTYEQVQENDDVDGDGVKNGEKYSFRDKLPIPKEAVVFDGRYYARYDTGYIWEDVEALCESYGGHLLTITSAEERDFVKELLKDGTKSTYWLGATDVETEGDFRWVTGEEWDFTDWAPLEPNNDGAEDYVEIETWSDYRWNDGERDGDYGMFSKSNHGFVCEWESDAVNVVGYVYINGIKVGRAMFEYD